MENFIFYPFLCIRGTGTRTRTRGEVRRNFVGAKFDGSPDKFSVFAHGAKLHQPVLQIMEVK